MGMQEEKRRGAGRNCPEFLRQRNVQWAGPWPHEPQIHKHEKSG